MLANTGHCYGLFWANMGLHGRGVNLKHAGKAHHTPSPTQPPPEPLHLVSGLVADVQTLKVQHPDLAILVSLGGDSVAGEVIEILKTSLPLLFLRCSAPSCPAKTS